MTGRHRIGDKPAVTELTDGVALLVVQTDGGNRRLTKEQLAQGITDAMSEEEYIRSTEINENGELLLTVL